MPKPRDPYTPATSRSLIQSQAFGSYP